MAGFRSFLTVLRVLWAILSEFIPTVGVATRPAGNRNVDLEERC